MTQQLTNNAAIKVHQLERVISFLEPERALALSSFLDAPKAILSS
jgi:hypothetical protein